MLYFSVLGYYSLPLSSLVQLSLLPAPCPHTLISLLDLSYLNLAPIFSLDYLLVMSPSPYPLYGRVNPYPSLSTNHSPPASKVRKNLILVVFYVPDCLLFFLIVTYRMKTVLLAIVTTGYLAVVRAGCDVTTFPQDSSVPNVFNCKASCRDTSAGLIHSNYSCQKDATKADAVQCKCSTSDCFPLPIALGC